MASVTSKNQRTLFWINGPVPSEDDMSEARELAGQGHSVVFRNSQHVPEDGSLEAFDALAGDHIPARYADELANRKPSKEAAKSLSSTEASPVRSKPSAKTGTSTSAGHTTAWSGKKET
jgi:hypothetical protein